MYYCGENEHTESTHEQLKSGYAEGIDALADEVLELQRQGEGFCCKNALVEIIHRAIEASEIANCPFCLMQALLGGGGPRHLRLKESEIQDLRGCDADFVGFVRRCVVAGFRDGVLNALVAKGIDVMAVPDACRAQSPPQAEGDGKVVQLHGDRPPMPGSSPQESTKPPQRGQTASQLTVTAWMLAIYGACGQEPILEEDLLLDALNWAREKWQVRVGRLKRDGRTRRRLAEALSRLVEGGTLERVGTDRIRRVK